MGRAGLSPTRFPLEVRQGPVLGRGSCSVAHSPLLFPQGHSNGNRRYESDEDSLGSSGRVMRPEASWPWLRACLFQPLFPQSCHSSLPRRLTHQLKEDFAKKPVALAYAF